MPTLLTDLFRGYGRSLVLRVAAALIVIPLGCAFVFVPLWLVTSLDMSIWVLILPVLLFLAILFGGGGAVAAWILYRRKREWDAVFTPLGLTGRPYLTFFRQYHGTVEGQQVDVYFYRGPVLKVEVGTSLQTRLGVTGRQQDTLALAGLLGHQPLSMDELGLGDLSVFAIDEQWARSLLANPHVPGLLRRLTTLEGFFTRQQVILRPGALGLLFTGNKNLFGFGLTLEQTRQWLGDALRLVRIAEHLELPQVTDQESPAERLARSLRDRNPYLVPIIAAGAILGIFLCSAATVILMGLMNRSP
jgi:hypothetical protein